LLTAAAQLILALLNIRPVASIPNLFLERMIDMQIVHFGVLASFKGGAKRYSRHSILYLGADYPLAQTW